MNDDEMLIFLEHRRRKRASKPIFGGYPLPACLNKAIFKGAIPLATLFALQAAANPSIRDQRARSARAEREDNKITKVFKNC